MENWNENNKNFVSSCKWILESYSKGKQEEFGKHELATYIRSTAPSILQEDAKLDQAIYEVKGSPGQGGWAEIPWIAVFNKLQKASAQRGYYIVFLFRSDFEGFYISLNQGWTYFEKKYGVDLGKKKLEIVSKRVRELLHTIPSEQGLINIDLKSNRKLPQGYMKGHICGTYYDQTNLQNPNKIIKDLNRLIITYEEVVHLMNGRTLEQFNDYILLNDDQFFLEDDQSEEEFQESILKIEKGNLSVPHFSEDNPELRPTALIDNGGSQKWSRDARKAARAIINNNFRCAFDESHRTFISKKSGEFYVEAHHLLPMYLQNIYEHNLDRVANIFALCPNCHRMVHYGRDEDKVVVLLKLYTDRIVKLESLGLGITFSELCKAYGITKGGNHFERSD